MKRPLVILAAIVLAAPLLAAVETPQSASAADPALWNPGYIISDAVFYDGGSLSGDAVQGFLQQRVSSCISGYTCLKDYVQATPSIAADSYCAPYAGSAGERAADIIAKVGAACSINPKALLVLLEKEQSLVTSRSPSSGRYTSATGFSCPDTAPCDPAFSGFFYQVYYAARQFQRYAATPNQWNYQAGRVNNILYNPNSGCGASGVYIQNKATAALYIYTPYQPNGAALANMYGTGDGCSSYGNRNFWRIFTDWFGSPIEASSLMRTVDDSSVYLVSGDYKYPVPSIAILTSLAPLGQVAYVSQSYLDKFATSHVVGRSLRGPDGSIYFYDSGMKLPFNSCGQAANYGASCDPSGYVQLTEAQIAAFVTGPVLTSVLGTVEGSRYFIDKGTKAEIMDADAQAQAGITDGINVLTENAVAHLPLANPVIRDGAFLSTRGTGASSLLSQGTRYPIQSGNESAVGVYTRPSGSLSPASVARIPASSTTYSGLITAGSNRYVVAADGRYDLTGGGLKASAQPVPVSQAFVDSFAVKGTIAPGTFIKSPTKADVYVTMPNDIRPISGWSALLSLTPPGRDVSITLVSQALVDSLAQGPDALDSGTMVRSPEDATVYLMNGVTDRIAFSSFVFPVEAGFKTLTFATGERLAAYPLNTQLMSFGFVCGTSQYVGAGGQLHLVDPSVAANYPFPYVTLDPFVCAQASVGAPAGNFIRTPDGSIYQLVNGEKRPLTSMDRFSAISNGEPWMNVAELFANLMPTGPLA